ncbi:MAG TPA: DnaJ family molecular chaperone [Bauldia sp.]|nr:DnaJ family molecular chaperone [Bauldia sp.]
MTIWLWMSEIAASGADAVGGAADWLVGLFANVDPEARRQVAFSVALIALSAKMAKADGVVTADEVAAFRRYFEIPPEEERNVRRLFDLAKRDVAGYETYAERIGAFYEHDRRGLEDVVDGLFAIAKADGAVHEREIAYLERVAAIFGIDEAGFERIAARHVIPEDGDPYLVLGIDRSLPMTEVRARYRALAAENHPDRLLARGVPPEAAAIAHERMAAINLAWQRIQLERR